MILCCLSCAAFLSYLTLLLFSIQAYRSPTPDPESSLCPSVPVVSTSAVSSISSFGTPCTFNTMFSLQGPLCADFRAEKEILHQHINIIMATRALGESYLHDNGRDYTSSSDSHLSLGQHGWIISTAIPTDLACDAVANFLEYLSWWIKYHGQK